MFFGNFVHIEKTLVLSCSFKFFFGWGISLFILFFYCRRDDVMTTEQTQKHPEYTGPRMGPKMADKNEREFTEEQLRAHEGHIGLQAGFNKGASQAGVGGFGNTRHM